MKSVEIVHFDTDKNLVLNRCNYSSKRLKNCCRFCYLECRFCLSLFDPKAVVKNYVFLLALVVDLRYSHFLCVIILIYHSSKTMCYYQIFIAIMSHHPSMIVVHWFFKYPKKNLEFDRSKCILVSICCCLLICMHYFDFMNCQTMYQWNWVLCQYLLCLWLSIVMNY